MVLYDILKYFNIILIISVERVFRNVNYRGWGAGSASQVPVCEHEALLRQSHSMAHICSPCV